jgi:hypothetical protein
MPSSVHCVLCRKGGIHMQNVEVVVEQFITESEVGLARTSDGQRVSFMFSRLRKAGYAHRNGNGIHVIDSRIIPGVTLIVDIELHNHIRPRVSMIHSVVGIEKNYTRSRLPVDARGIGSLDWHSDRGYGFLRVTHLQEQGALLPVTSHAYQDLFVHGSDVHSAVHDCLGVAKTFSFIVIPRRNGDVCGKITKNHGYDKAPDG